MPHRRYTVWILTLPALLALVLAAGCGQQRPGAGSEVPWFIASDLALEKPARVGTVNRIELLIAYHRSVMREARIGQLIVDRDAARAQGNTELARSIEAEGAALQDLAHRQLAGRAPLTNITQALAAEIRAVAEEAGVDAIYEEGGYRGRGLRVDLTEALVSRITPARPEPEWLQNRTR
jgi:hypothetical protein